MGAWLESVRDDGGSAGGRAGELRLSGLDTEDGWEYPLLRRKKGEGMQHTESPRAITVYFTERTLAKKPVERLRKLAKARDRSVNYLTIEALLGYLDREEAKQAKSRSS